MALGSGDRARLRQIESGLADADPVLAETFRQWRSPGGGVPTPRGWSTMPTWMLVVFLVGSVTWVLGAVLGALVAVVGGLWLLAARTSRGPERRRRPRSGRGKTSRP